MLQAPKRRNIQSDERLSINLLHDHLVLRHPPRRSDRHPVRLAHLRTHQHCLLRAIHGPEVVRAQAEGEGMAGAAAVPQ